MPQRILVAAVMMVALVGCSDPQGQPQKVYTHQSLSVGDEAAFNREVLANAGPSVVKFSSTRCGPCQELAPTFEALAGEHAEKAKFVSIDVNEAPSLADKYEVWRIPTVIAFNSGKEVGRLTGLHPRRDYENMIKKLP